MGKRIVYTRHDGGVSVCCPTQEVLRWMCVGGLWAGLPRGFVDDQIDLQIAAGHKPDAARRYANAVTLGGCSTAEAYEIIRDRDCGHLGSGHELWNVEDVPVDRWFRNAWIRSHNGGPIDLCLKRAKAIQFQRIKGAIDRENKRRAADVDLFHEPVVGDWGRIRDQIIAAGDLVELRRVWPLC
jgi:hypothetical protein